MSYIVRAVKVVVIVRLERSKASLFILKLSTFFWYRSWTSIVSFIRSFKFFFCFSYSRTLPFNLNFSSKQLNLKFFDVNYKLGLLSFQLFYFVCQFSMGTQFDLFPMLNLTFIILSFIFSYGSSIFLVSTFYHIFPWGR